MLHSGWTRLPDSSLGDISTTVSPASLPFLLGSAVSICSQPSVTPSDEGPSRGRLSGLLPGKSRRPHKTHNGIRDPRSNSQRKTGQGAGAGHFLPLNPRA